MNEYLPNKKLSINIRPIQFCYFYRKGNKKELKKILQYVNTQWGGIYNLIIPILANGKTYPFYEKTLEIHTPDKFVSTLDNEINKELKKHLQKIVPKRKIEIGSFDSFIEFDDSAHPLGFIDYDKKFGYSLLCPKVNFNKNRDLLQLALFGEIYPDQIKEYRNILSVQDFKNFDTSDQIIKSQFWISPNHSPINFTSINIRPYSVPNAFFAGSDVIDLVVGDDETAIVYYWNLRALREKSQINKSDEFGRKVLLMPLKFLRDIDLFKRFFMGIKRSFRGGYQDCNLNICIDHIPKKQIKSLHKNISALGDFKKFKEKKISMQFGNTKSKPNRDKLTYMIYSPLWLWSEPKIGAGVQNHIIQDLKLNYNEIIFSPPKGFTNRYKQEVAIDIISDIWSSYPKSKLLADKVRNNSYFSKYGLTSFCGANKNTTSFGFNVLDDWTKLRIFFEENGYQIRPSKISSYSRSTVKLLGGIKDLKILNDKLVIELLNVLAVKSSKKLAQKISSKISPKNINERTLLKIFNDYNLAPELASIPKTYDELRTLSQLILYKSKVLTTLNELSKKQIIKRGFYIECSSCGVKEWYSLASADEFLICPGCNYKFNLPIEEQKNVETKWRYRLNSLINRAVDQDILTALVVVGHLAQRGATNCHYFGVELIKGTNKNPETDIDFVFTENQKIIAGECKTNDGFTKKDFYNALLLSKIGIDEFYFCTLSEFSVNSLKMVDDFKNSLIKKKIPMKVQTISSVDLFK